MLNEKRSSSYLEGVWHQLSEMSTPVTVEGKRLSGEVHLLELLLIAPTGVLHSQVDIAGVGARCIAENSGCRLPKCDSHLLSLCAMSACQHIHMPLYNSLIFFSQMAATATLHAAARCGYWRRRFLAVFVMHAVASASCTHSAFEQSLVHG